MASHHAIFQTVRDHLYTLPVETVIGHRELVEVVAQHHGLISRVQHSDLVEALLSTGMISRIPGTTTFKVHHPSGTVLPIRSPYLEERVAALEKEMKTLKALISDALISAGPVCSADLPEHE